jgi:hypothetical protein
VHRTHGMAFTPECWAWYGMVDRCINPKNRAYKYYGSRGITVCERWLIFTQFIEDIPLRPSPEYSLDRINNDGHYSCGTCSECVRRQWPMNVRWTTKAEQMRNRRNTIWITIADITLCATDWAVLIGISVPTFKRYLIQGNPFHTIGPYVRYRSSDLLPG